jgi:hemolysin activation/secretion protein
MRPLKWSSGGTHRVLNAATSVFAGALVVLALFAPPAFSQQPEAASPELHFEIVRYQLEGNTLLEPADIERVLAPFTGKQKDFSDIQRALEALEAAYREIGYGAVQVNLPEQNIASGVVVFKITEPRLGRVDVDGAKRFDQANVRRSIPALREGQVPNTRQIARNVLLANENPSRQLTVLMRAGESDDQVDATIKVVEDKPWKASLTLDNTGTTATGALRVAAGYQHANLFNRDHVLTMQYVTSPNHVSEVTIFGLSYRVPLYDWGSAIEAVVGYSDVNSGTLPGLFSVSGSGLITSLRYNQYLTKLGDYEQKLLYGLDYKAFQNQVTSAGQSIVPDITVQPVSVTYQGTLRGERSETGFYLSASQNIFPGGNDGADSDFKASRADAKASFRAYRYGFNYSRAFAADWQARFVMTGQYTQNALVAGEQFGIGGADNLRGFLEREVAGDHGYRGNVELYTPNLASKFGWKDTQTRLLVFYDWGTVTGNSIPPGQSPGQSLASTGVGMRLASGKRFTMRVDFARVLDGGGSQDKGHSRVHALLGVTF